MAFQKTEKKGLVRDTKSKALLNTDLESLMSYKKQRKLILDFIETNKKYDEKEKEINAMKMDIHEMKNMLTQILEKLNK